MTPRVRPTTTTPAAATTPAARSIQEIERHTTSVYEDENAETMTFDELGIAPDLVKVLRAQKIDAPFAIQVHAIPTALEGRDICGKARTGSGKTLAFGLPMVQLGARSQPHKPWGLVLVPTRELATQVARALAPLAAARKLRLDTVFGGVSMGRQIAAFRSGVDIVIATPGRLNDLLERGEVSVAEAGMVVVDEADQMADMGFLPQVERILNQVKSEHQTLLFSATLDGDVDRLIRRYQHDPSFVEVQAPNDMVDTMEHRFIGVSDAEKLQVAGAIVDGPDRSLLFVRTQRNADRLVMQLGRLGIRAGLLHGGLSQNKRDRALADFQKGYTPVLVATNLAARGIHVDDIATVIHYDPPEEFKAYVHRSGRTARAGAAGLVVTLVLPGESRHIGDLRRLAGLRVPTVEMHPDDPRLRDLAGWVPEPMKVEPIRPVAVYGSPNLQPSHAMAPGRRNSAFRPAGRAGGQRRSF